jgi:ABC-2 type transport system permease protein
LILVLPFLFNLLCAILGLIINLYFPKLDWVSETAAVKQSISTMLAMLVCVLLVLIPGALYIGMLVDIIALQNFECILLCIYVVLSIAGYGYLMKQGIKILERL